MGSGPFAYLWLVAKTACRHSFHAAHSAILVLIIFAGIVTSVDPRIQVLVDLQSWQVAAFVLGGIVIVRLLLAPYWIWKSDQNNLAILRDELSSDSRAVRRAAAKRAAIDDLAEEINWATQNLVNPNPHPLREGNVREQIEAWRAQCDEWYKRVSDKLSIFTRSQQLHFDVLTKVEQVVTVGNMEFGHPYNILHTKIIRLREIIAQMGQT